MRHEAVTELYWRARRLWNRLDTPDTPDVDRETLLRLQFGVNLISGIALLVLLGLSGSELSHGTGWEGICRALWIVFVTSWAFLMATRAFPGLLQRDSGWARSAIMAVLSLAIPFLADLSYKLGPDQVFGGHAG